MSVDHGHLRSMRLLPFAAAAGDLLTFWMQTSRTAVIDGRWCRSEVFADQLRSLLVGAVAAPCCCTSRALTLNRQWHDQAEMSDTGLTVPGMIEPSRRYDVTITVDQD